MPESNAVKSKKKMQIRYRGRGSQIWICLGKLLRMFVYQNDWKVLPMAALVAGLVGMVIRRRMFLNMEGTLMGSFALVCVCIWNGAFNSIQSVCRERDVIKREHRSGLHISSYIIAHMIYQALLCLMQTGITLYVAKLTGIQFPEEGLFTRWLIVDLGISMFLITYASDMLSLWISTLAKSSTTAMTIMPFVLIFQLVFSGGMITLRPWTKPLTEITISNPGLKVISAQADTNNRPFVTISDMIGKMHDNEIETTITLRQVLDTLERTGDPELGGVVETIRSEPEIQEYLDQGKEIRITVGKLLQLAGEDNVMEYLETSAAQASYKPEYDNNAGNIMGYWARLVLFIFVYALLAMITLEFIDKDKR